jgi:hypothetical protein
MARTARKTARLVLERLEDRLQPSVSSCFLFGYTLAINSDNTNTSVAVSSVTNPFTHMQFVKVTDHGTSNTWNFFASQVYSVYFTGGTASNTFTNYVNWLPCTVDGSQGVNDTFVSYSQGNIFHGGPGTNAMAGYGYDVFHAGSFQVGLPDSNFMQEMGNGGAFYGSQGYYFGGVGTNTMIAQGDGATFHGGSGTNTMIGYGSYDTFYGQGTSTMVAWGNHEDLYAGPGRSTMLAINGQGTNRFWGGTGPSIVWAGVHDFVAGVTHVQRVNGFANGASLVPHSAGVNPSDGMYYKNFSSNPLFGLGIPSRDDVFQTWDGPADRGGGGIGDCWMMGTLSAVAYRNPARIQSMVVDFRDGTYGVALGGSFYRVDGWLPTRSASSTTPQYATLGQGNSLWAPIVEKAYAKYRTGANTYASLTGGEPGDAFDAFGCSNGDGWTPLGLHSGASAIQELYNHYQAGQACVVCLVWPDNSGSHCMSLISMNRDSDGNVTSIYLRNEVGGGYVTYTRDYFIAQWDEIRWANA